MPFREVRAELARCEAREIASDLADLVIGAQDAVRAGPKVSEHLRRRTKDKAFGALLVAELAKPGEDEPREVQVGITVVSRTMIVHHDRTRAMPVLVLAALGLEQGFVNAVFVCATMKAEQATASGIDNGDTGAEHVEA